MFQHTSASYLLLLIVVDFSLCYRVKKHKKEYVACRKSDNLVDAASHHIISYTYKSTTEDLSSPILYFPTSPYYPAKAQKPMYSILIYDEIRSMQPPGRFLKQDPETKLWSDIGKKKALDKTRQALREGAPDMLKELGDDEDGGGEEGMKLKSGSSKSKRRREDNPLNSSFMSNTSIGSFSVDAVPSPDLFSNQAQGMPSGAFGGMLNSLQNNQGVDANQLLMNAQMQLIQQQMQQWQQLASMQNSLPNQGNQMDINNQLQLLNLQLQLQLGQQQNAQNIPNFINFQNQSAPTFPVQSGNANAPQPQLNEQNIAALLTALQNNPSATNNVPAAGQTQYPNLGNFQNQMAMLQLNNQINNANQAAAANVNSNAPGAVPGNNIENILSAANAIKDNVDGSNSEQAAESPAEPNPDRKKGGTSLARSQRIGLKNSFTRRPNTHKQTTNHLNHSLVGADDMNLDGVDEMSEDEGMQED